MNYHDTWFAFNAPAIIVLIIGELAWLKIRNIVMRKDISNGRDS